MAVMGPRFAPGLAVMRVGAVGTVAGVTAAERAEKAPVPTALVARTWNWYAVPLVNPVTPRLVAPAVAGRNAPTWVLVPLRTTRTWNPVIGEPPSLPGVQLTVADAFPRVTAPSVGAAGATATPVP